MLLGGDLQKNSEEAWKYDVQMGGMGIYCSNGNNRKLLSRSEEWEVAVQMGVMGSYCPDGRNGSYCPIGSNGKLLFKWE